MFCDKKNLNPKMDFEEAIDKLYQDNRSTNVLFEFYYSQLNSQKSNVRLNENYENVFYPNSPTSELDFDLNVIQVSIKQ